MDVFKNLKEEFNIDEAEEKIEQTSNKIEEINQGIATQKYTIEDKEYLRVELQDLITSDREVMESLKDQLKVGAIPHLYTVYAELSKSVRENLSQLLDLDKKITDYQVIESAEEYKNKVLESKERIATKRLDNKQGNINKLSQVNNNTYIFNPKEQLAAIKDITSNIEKAEEILPTFDLS